MITRQSGLNSARTWRQRPQGATGWGVSAMTARALNMPLAGGDSGKDGHPLGADGGAEGGVFDVAAGEDAAVGGEDGGAHGEVGIGSVGGVSGLAGGGQQIFK